MKPRPPDPGSDPGVGIATAGGVEIDLARYRASFERRWTRMARGWARIVEVVGALRAKVQLQGAVEIVGMGLIVAGVALVWVPAALVAGGLGMVLWSQGRG